MPPVLPTSQAESIKKQIVTILQEVPFERAIEREDFRELIKLDSKSERPLFPPDAVVAFEEARDLRAEKRSNPTPGFFVSNKSVLIVPGFMGSQLRDDGPTGNELIWIDPKLYFTSSAEKSELSALQLAEYAPGEPDRDRGDRVAVREDGSLPILYAGLRYYLETGRCEVRTAAFDWRKDLDESANLLTQTIRAFTNEHPGRPFFLIAHSQGSLVARRALQLLGKEESRRRVNRLILLGPASYGTFSAAFAIAGNHQVIESLKHYGLEWPDDLKAVLQSFTGLYQLLPWKAGTIDGSMKPEAMAESHFWETGVDKKRLAKFYRWGESLDTAFFNDRTTIILGDDGKVPATPSAVKFENKVLTTAAVAKGDGTVPDGCALIEGVTDLARAKDADHMTLPLKRNVMQMVWRIILANISIQSAFAPRFHDAGKLKKSETHGDKFIIELPEPVDLFKLAGTRRRLPAVRDKKAIARPDELKPKVAVDPNVTDMADAPPAPSVRRLRVFSFDPLLASDPEMLGIESIVLKLDWDDESNDGAKLLPGPVGEYLEVVDYDPASRCFYPPVNLNHPNLLAQDGMPLSETDPRFHQQMVYAVGMATIGVFERALGRTIQWSPNLVRDANGKVIQKGTEFVRRLRIYPHAMRDANAYYDPRRKALLFGYFPARSKPGGRVLPKGYVFTCLSFDVVAHEMTHAILDGMHRRFLEPSNGDVLAFHEAFADIVALFQHFSHPEVLRVQVAKVAGNLQNENLLGQLAQEFGEAMGLHGSLRSYLGKRDPDTGKWKAIDPDPTLLETVTEPHDRGSILVAAMFTAFLTIYRLRTRDLLRIATKGSGVLPPGDLHPDLVNRLAEEAAKAARHLLTMAIRALDYSPPVDLNFGNYLRALITSDIDIVPTDSRLYRLAVLDAFRQWGIYPEHVANLSVDSLIWNPPQSSTIRLDLEYFREILSIGGGNLQLDRAELYQRQRAVQEKLHAWMRAQFIADPNLAREWGLAVSGDAPKTIEREGRAERLPKFEIHSVRRSRRKGPDGQERVDILIEVLQKRDGYFSEADQVEADAGKPPKGGKDFDFRGGATLIVDPRAGRIRYAITKSISSDKRLAQVREFIRGHGSALGLRGNYFSRERGDNPFPHLHAGED